MSVYRTRWLRFLSILIVFSLLIACNLPQNTINFWVEYLTEPFADSNVAKCKEEGGVWDVHTEKCIPLSTLPSVVPPNKNDNLDPPPPEPLPDEESDAAPLLALDEELPGDVTMVGALTVRLIPLDVRVLDNPPDTIAIAQYSTTPPPANVIIESAGGLWKSGDGEKIALYGGGDWISATCSDQNVTAVGVRFESGENDGWVRVLVDGAEVWQGSIYGGNPGSAEGMFLYYLEISGLVPGVHTIKVENLGINGKGGGDDAAMRYFGFSSTPVSGYSP